VHSDIPYTLLKKMAARQEILSEPLSKTAPDALFSYDSVEDHDGVPVYQGVKFLRDFGGKPKGTEFTAVAMHVQLTTWINEEDNDELDGNL
jgi:hypothetical protein